MQCLLLTALIVSATPATGSRVAARSAPDVSGEVRAEAAENLQIHDGFVAQEQQDEAAEARLRVRHDLSAMSYGKWVVALDRDVKTSMLVQVVANASHPEIKDPCGNIQCAASLICPGTFKVETVPGHCCPYCA